MSEWHSYVIMKVKHQTKGNMLNAFVKNVHAICPICKGPVTGKDGAFHHVFQKDKKGRPAELAKGDKDKLMEEYERVVPLCTSCHNRLARSITQDELNLLAKLLKVYNTKLNGIQYRIGIPLPILEVVKWIIFEPRSLMDMDDDNKEYDVVIRRLIILAKSQKPEA